MRITATLRNVSGRQCGAINTTHSLTVLDASGTALWGTNMTIHRDCFPGTGCTGPTFSTETAAGCWDQLNTATGQPAAVGTYTVRVEWEGPVVPSVSASSTFQIVADPAAPTTTVPADRCP